jgi:hypothetical protein
VKRSIRCYEPVTAWVARRDHPQLAGSFDWLVRDGRLTAVLPSICASPDVAHGWQTRARALTLRHQDAVLLGAAAARISFWPDAPLNHVDAAVCGVLKPRETSRGQLPNA